MKTMRQDVLPPAFGNLQVTNVKKKSNNEYSGACPWCGGDDRFVLFVVGRGGFPFAFCRQDPENHRWTPANDHKLSDAEVAEFRRNQIEVEKARIEASRRTIEILQNDRLWELFFQQNNDWSRDVFRGWGIADSWVEYLKLGLIPDYTVKSNGCSDYHSPAFTIPVWGTGGIVQNIKLRMANPKSDRDRYRNFYSTGQSFLFVPLYDLPLVGICVLVEGEKKSIVVEQTLDDVNYRVVGLQSVTPSEELIKQLGEFEVIYLGLDPDGFTKADKQQETPVERMTRLLGKERVRIVEFPCKPDDGIVYHGLDPKRYINMARKA